jgi:hypothetical protein
MSVGESGFLHRSGDPLTSGSATITPGLERQHVGEHDAPVAAPRQALRWDLTLVEEPDYERPRETEQLGDLRGRQSDLRRQDGDGVAVGQLVR